MHRTKPHVLVRSESSEMHRRGGPGGWSHRGTCAGEVPRRVRWHPREDGRKTRQPEEGTRRRRGGTVHGTPPRGTARIPCSTVHRLSEFGRRGGRISHHAALSL